MLIGGGHLLLLVHGLLHFFCTSSLAALFAFDFVQDEEERRRLDRVFGLERAKSSQRIMRITEEHEMVLANRMAEEGLIR